MLKQFSCSAGRKKFERLWGSVIHLKQPTQARPLLEAILSPVGRNLKDFLRPPKVFEPVEPPLRPNRSPRRSRTLDASRRLLTPAAADFNAKNRTEERHEQVIRGRSRHHHGRKLRHRPSHRHRLRPLRREGGGGQPARRRIGGDRPPLYPQLAPALPQPRVGHFSLAYAVPRGEPDMLNMVDTFIDTQRANGRLESARTQWILGEATRVQRPRWSVARDVLGW